MFKSGVVFKRIRYYGKDLLFSSMNFIFRYRFLGLSFRLNWCEALYMCLCPLQFKLQYTEALNAGLTFDLLSHQLWFAAQCNCTCLENPGNKLAIEGNVLCAPFYSCTLIVKWQY